MTNPRLDTTTLTAMDETVRAELDMLTPFLPSRKKLEIVIHRLASLTEILSLGPLDERQRARAVSLLLHISAGTACWAESLATPEASFDKVIETQGR